MIDHIRQCKIFEKENLTKIIEKFNAYQISKVHIKRNNNKEINDDIYLFIEGVG